MYWNEPSYRTVSDPTELEIVLSRAPEQGVGSGLCLPDREKAIRELTRRGMSLRVIGLVLGCSPRTVARHRVKMRQGSECP